MRPGYNPFTGRLRGPQVDTANSLMDDIPIARRPRALRTVLDNIAQVCAGAGRKKRGDMGGRGDRGMRAARDARGACVCRRCR